MIAGILIRHYKIYNNGNYIPILSKSGNSFTLFIGNNGVGKSSVLEALNTFFNNAYWNRTKGEKQDQTFICPIFLIKKKDISKKVNLSQDDISALEVISNYLINLETTTSKEINDFITIKNQMNVNPNEYFLIICGITYKDRNKAYFSSGLHTEIVKQIQESIPEYKIDNILNILKKFYAFIYIPIESKMTDFLKLETMEMQKLMNENILEAIENVLKGNNFKVKDRTRLISLVDYINNKLNQFMDEINTQIKKIDSNYSFKVEDGYKKNLTASDLRNQILKAYFSIRTLKKDNKEIYELSSGEQRIALIDIATAFLNNSKESLGQIILAIDEPEASLHISKCYQQFKRLEKLSLHQDAQVLLTTHWYGSIPTIQKGNLNHIEFSNKPSIRTFDFNNYLEDRRNFPDDIDLKSFFELVSTIISSIKSDKTNWLIIEGSDDKCYFEVYLQENIKNLVILPVGGAGNVIKIFEYLFVPFSEKVEKGILKNSKVLCLIDSDREQKTTKLNNPDVEKFLKISRLQVSENGAVLKSLHNIGEYVNTVVEDCLDPRLLYTAIHKTLQSFDNDEMSNLFKEFKYDASATLSRIDTENSILKPKTIEALENKKVLIDFLKTNEFKVELSKKYAELTTSVKHDTPDIFKLVIDFFK